MRLLAIDTATEYCSVAFSNGMEQCSYGEEAPQQHANLILPMVQKTLTTANTSLAELEGIVIGAGPGSFTGVRIAAGIGQGLAFSQNLPVVGVSSLQALAQQAYRKQGATHVIAAIDARMGEVYFGAYELVQGLMQPLTKDLVGAPEQMVLPAQKAAAQWHCVGTGFVTYPALIEWLGQSAQGPTPHLVAIAEVRFPHAQDMLAIGRALFSAGAGVAAEQFDVHYVRNEVTWQKLPGRT